MLSVPKRKTSNCQKFGHTLSFLLALILPTLASAQAWPRVGRAPASDRDSVMPAPAPVSSWVSDIFVEDDRGVMRDMKQQVETWQEREAYAQMWNLESTGLYQPVDNAEKSSYLRRGLLRYVDKRLAGEVRQAPKNSALYSVVQVQQTLSPSSNVEVSDNLKVRFRARVLEGKASMTIQNPVFDYETTVKVNGRVGMRMGKDISQLGLRTSMNYDVREGRWIASMDKEITGPWAARVSSEQNDDQMAFSHATDRKVQLNFNQSF